MKFLTAGESHGPGLTILLDNVPAGIPISSDLINQDLRRRQGGYGRGGRMMIEKDTVRFLAGVRFGKTTGAPIALFIENKDHKNWAGIMDAEGEPTDEKAFIRPRPGHADLAGFYKYGLTDLRDALERASARETAARVAAGAVAKALLKAVGIDVFSYVHVLGGKTFTTAEGLDYTKDVNAFMAYVEGNDLRCASDEATQQAVRQYIDEVRKAGSTLGGEVHCVATGVPAGLGSYVQWDRKLDGRLAQAVMAVQAIKGVEIGLGFEASPSGITFKHAGRYLHFGRDGDGERVKLSWDGLAPEEATLGRQPELADRWILTRKRGAREVRLPLFDQGLEELLVRVLGLPKPSE